MRRFWTVLIGLCLLGLLLASVFEDHVALAARTPIQQSQTELACTLELAIQGTGTVELRDAQGTRRPTVY